MCLVMVRIRRCQDCGKGADEVYLSRKDLCRDCAVERAVVQVDLVYDVAEACKGAGFEGYAESYASIIGDVDARRMAARQRIGVARARIAKRRAAQAKPVRPSRAKARPPSDQATTPTGSDSKAARKAPASRARVGPTGGR